MINMVGVEYVLPPPRVAPDIPAVVASMPKRGLRRGRNKEEENKKKRRSLLDDMIMSKEEREELGQMGCFFEAQA